MDKRTLVAWALLPLVAAACDNSREKAVSKIKDDQEVVQRASAVVNDVLRNQTDCEAAKPLIPEAYQRIQEAEKVVTAPATRTTLGALKSQVDRVAQACP